MATLPDAMIALADPETVATQPQATAPPARSDPAPRSPFGPTAGAGVIDRATLVVEIRGTGVPRKRDPDQVVDGFREELATSLNEWAQIQGRLAGKSALAKRSSVDAFTRAAVGFERFRSDWHVAAIARDTNNFSTNQLKVVHDTLKQAGKGQLESYVKTLALPAHPTLEQIEDLLDPSQGNLSIPSLKAWKKKATEHLEDPWKSLVLKLPDKRDGPLFAAVIAIRNAAAHESPRSATRMKNALTNLTHAADDPAIKPTRGVTVSGIPSYLNGQAAGHDRRAKHYHRRLDQIARALRHGAGGAPPL